MDLPFNKIDLNLPHTTNIKLPEELFSRLSDLNGQTDIQVLLVNKDMVPEEIFGILLDKTMDDKLLNISIYDNF